MAPKDRYKPASVQKGVAALAILLAGGLYVIVSTNPPVDRGTEARLQARGTSTTLRHGPPPVPGRQTATTTPTAPSPTFMPAGAVMETFVDGGGRYHVTHPSTWSTSPKGDLAVDFAVPAPEGTSIAFRIQLRPADSERQKDILINGFVKGRQPADQTFPVTVAARQSTAVEHAVPPGPDGRPLVQLAVYVDIGPAVATLTYEVSGPGAATARQQFLEALTTFFVP